MKHSYAEIPQEESAVIANTTESISLLITSPRVERNRRNPGVMTLAASNNLAFWERPNSNKVVLATSDDVFAIGRPTNAD